MYVKTLRQQMEEMQADCVTLKDWAECYEWMLEKNTEVSADLQNFKEAIVQKYGIDVMNEISERSTEIYDEMIEQRSNLSNPFIPNEILAKYGFGEDITGMWGGLAKMALEQGCEVLALSPDGTSKVVTSEEEITAHAEECGLFGIKEEEMDKFLEEKGYGSEDFE